MKGHIKEFSACVVQASTFVMFPDVHSACRAASILRDETAVDAVELFDTASLRCACLLAAGQPTAIIKRGLHICMNNLYLCLLHLSLDLRSARAVMRPSMKPCEASEDMCLDCLLATVLGMILAPLRGVRRNVCGRECAKDEGMARLVPDIVDADDGAAGLLIECRGWDEGCLKVGLAVLVLCCAVLWV